MKPVIYQIASDLAEKVARPLRLTFNDYFK
jgi:hypothetical protein